MIALVLVASASFLTVEAAKKKTKTVEAAAPVVQPQQLLTSADSVSYAGYLYYQSRNDSRDW